MSDSEAQDSLKLDHIYHGDCIQVLAGFPEKSVDLIFADPPYNLQLDREIYRPNMTRVARVDDPWDKFESLQAYDDFSRQWLGACRRVLKDDGTIWVIGTYHNIYRLGAMLQDMGFWFLNDFIWIKSNPMPNFLGMRFTNAHETLIWACKFKGARYTFNHQAMKGLNDGKQMRSDWRIPLCSGAERLRVDGKRAHSAQKPEALLYRVILASSLPGDIVLDPFFGSGTTGAVAKKLHRRWIGIERKEEYIRLAQTRIEAITPELLEAQVFEVRDPRKLAPRVAFSQLLEAGYLRPGQRLYFRGREEQIAHIKPDARLRLADGFEGSIHQCGKHLTGGSPCNGWLHWYYEDPDGNRQPVDRLREKYRAEVLE